MQTFSLLFISFFFFKNGATSDAEFESINMFETLREAMEVRDITPLLLLTHQNLTYSLCGHIGNYDTFPDYLKNQLKMIVRIDYTLHSDQAEIYRENQTDYLLFTFDTNTLYTDGKLVQGTADVLAIREPSDEIFRAIKITQKCRIQAKRHQLYRLFTYHDLYDY